MQYRKLIIVVMGILIIIVGLIMLQSNISFKEKPIVEEGLISKTSVIIPVNYTPFGIHLSFENDPAHDITFMWITLNRTDNSIVSIEFPNGSIINYSGYSLFYKGYYWHRVYVNGLPSDTLFRYRVGDPNFNMSEYRTFKTAPLEVERFVFSVYADQGINPHSIDAVSKVLEYNPEFHIHPGDISYGGGNIGVWIKWFKMVEPLASRVPYLIAIGNHEYDGTGDLSDIEIYFDMPGDTFTYSFRYSNAFFLSINLGPSDSVEPPSDLVVEIDEVLYEASTDNSIDWIIVFLHYPPYSSGKAHGSSKAAIPLIDLFDKYGVDLVFAGHEHNYERTYPIKSGEVVSMDTDIYNDINATIYVVVGGGGGGLYKDFVSPKPVWSYIRLARYSVGIVEVDGNKLSFLAIDTENGEVIDSFKIVKSIPEVKISSFLYITSLSFLVLGLVVLCYVFLRYARPIES